MLILDSVLECYLGNWLCPASVDLGHISSMAILKAVVLILMRWHQLSMYCFLALDLVSFNMCTELNKIGHASQVVPMMACTWMYPRLLWLHNTILPPPEQEIAIPSLDRR